MYKCPICSKEYDSAVDMAQCIIDDTKRKQTEEAAQAKSKHTQEANETAKLINQQLLALNQQYRSDMNKIKQAIADYNKNYRDVNGELYLYNGTLVYDNCVNLINNLLHIL